MGQDGIETSRLVSFTSDIDIDLADRNLLLAKIKHVPASIITAAGEINPHNTGVYVTEVPRDPVTGRASLDYKTAEQRGYVKLDFLNVNIYQLVKNEQHLIELMNKKPDWHALYTRSFCEQLVHIGNHYDSLIRIPEPVNSIPRLAMFLALIRPAKRHLMGLPWAEVAKTVWVPSKDGTYGFKQSHSISYANLIVVHMNLLNLSN
jgi:hypothetical protein